MKRRLAILFAPILILGLVTSAGAIDLNSVAEEVSREEQIDRRIVKIWWFPVEYWVEAGRQLKKSSEEIDRIRRLFRNYLLIGILDAEVSQDGLFDAATPSDIGPELEVRRNGVKIEILRDIDPKVARLTHELSYFAKASLLGLSSGLRIFFLPNLDKKGRPILQGLSSGELEVAYARKADAQEPFRFFWRTPLTSVAGSSTCPEGGELLEAHWLYCPWHGIRVR
jgi:hypothetical protein